MGNGSDGRSRASRRFDQAENSLRQRQARVSRVTSSSPKSSPVRDAERYPFCTFLLTLFKKPLENTIQAILFPRVKKNNKEKEYFVGSNFGVRVQKTVPLYVSSPCP